jgi:hypothetical protein
LPWSPCGNGKKGFVPGLVAFGGPTLACPEEPCRQQLHRAEEQEHDDDPRELAGVVGVGAADRVDRAEQDEHARREQPGADAPRHERREQELVGDVGRAHRVPDPVDRRAHPERREHDRERELDRTDLGTEDRHAECVHRRAARSSARTSSSST